MDHFLRRNLKPNSDSYLSQSKNKTLPVLNSIRTRLDESDCESYITRSEQQPVVKSMNGSLNHNSYHSHPLASTFRGSYSGAIESFDSRDLMEDKDTNAERVKLKIMSIWNNVKYGWSIKIRANFNPEIPIWLLGVKYQTRPGTYEASCNNQVLTAFREDFTSRIWLTYRRDFKRLPGSLLTSDRGWGCMLRTGQMMLSQALLNHYLGRDWRWNRTQSDKSGMIHRMIIKWFADLANADSPFSIHQLVRWGSILGRKPGDWFAPSSVAVLLREALDEAAPSYPILNNICIYVAHDCTIYLQDVIELCTKSLPHKKTEISGQDKPTDKPSEKLIPNNNNHKDEQEQGYFTLDREESHRASISSISHRRSSATTSSSGSSLYGRTMSTINLAESNIPSSSHHNHKNHNNHSRHNASSKESSSHSSSTSKLNGSEPIKEKWRSVVLIVPVRLGSDTLNPIYTSCIKALFRHKACIGIIGGRPKHSLYFVGYQDDKLIYLDPHNDQEAINAEQTDFPLDSYHCDFPRKISISRMDPSCAIAFYCRTRKDLMDLADSVGSLIVPKHNKLNYPIFVFNDGSSKSLNVDYENTYTEKTVRIKHRFVDNLGKIEAEYDADEFVMI